MKIPGRVLELIHEEQLTQNGLFIPSDPAYLQKLAHSAELIVHQDGSDVLGYIFFYCNAPDKRVTYITLIGTSAAARGRGVGSCLLRYVIQVGEHRGFACCQLEVHKANTHAIKFYGQFGFRVKEDRGDRYLMCMPIT